MEAAHQRLSNACVLVSKAAGTLEVACAEYEAAHLTLKRWQLTDSAPAGSSGAERTEQSNNLSSLGGTAIDDVLEQSTPQARNIRHLSLRETSKTGYGHAGRAADSVAAPKAPQSTSKRTLPREFLELKERYHNFIYEGGSGSVLLDIQVPVSDGSKEFMGKLSFRRRRASQPAQGEDRNSTAREDLVRARAVLKAISWIEDVLSKVDWGRFRHDELSTGKLCDTAYMLGNVVRLWKECAPEMEYLMVRASDTKYKGSKYMKVLRRRDEFLMIVSQSKKLRYPNRSIYSVLDSQAKHEMEATGRSNFLTWLPDECWHHTTPPLPPEPSLKCSRDQYVKIAVGRSCSEAFPPLRKCFFTTQ